MAGFLSAVPPHQTEARPLSVPDPDLSPLTPGLLNAARRLHDARPVTDAEARELARAMYPRAESEVIDQVVDLWRQHGTDDTQPAPRPVIIPID